MAGEHSFTGARDTMQAVVESAPSTHSDELVQAQASHRSRVGQADDIRSATAAVQRAGSAEEDTHSVHAAARHGVSGSGGALPHLEVVQRSFGPHDISGVQAHVGGKAAEASTAMGAQAYATGNDVAFRQSPDLHTTAHEAAHVVQQRGEVSLKGGVGQVGDPYERHADAVADRVVQGESAVDLLDQMAGGGGRAAVQMIGPNDADAGPAALDSDADEQTCRGEATWPETGNLIGNPPVRDRLCPPSTDVIEDETIYQERRAAAETSLATQTTRADAWLDREGNVTDNRYWFARVYQYVTEGELREAAARTFYYPSYVLQCVRYFEKIYSDNVEIADNHGTVEDHWQVAFDECKRTQGLTWDDVLAAGGAVIGGGAAGAASGAAIGGGVGSFAGGVGAVPGAVVGAKVGGVSGAIAGVIAAPAAAEVYGAVQSLVASMLAHIRFDLPRAEAWVFESHYAGQGEAAIEHFQPDFNSMTGIFEQAAAQMNTEIAERSGLPVDQMPQLLQDLAMTLWFEANMATERADTWDRAESLVEEGLAGDDPYTDTGSRLMGNVTRSTRPAGLDRLSERALRPTMGDPADAIDDNDARETSKASDLATRRTSERVNLIRAMLAGSTGDDDEASILQVIEASRTAGDLVTVIDGANAWDLAYATDGDEFDSLREVLRASYYPYTSQSMAFTLLQRCRHGETAEWEEEMIADLLTDRHDGHALVEMVGAAESGGGFEEGYDAISSDVDLGDQNRIDTHFGR